MRTWVALVSVVTVSCGVPCPQYLCRSTIVFQLSPSERAVLDEGESAVQVCVNAACTDFTFPATGARSAWAADDQLDLDAGTSKLSFFSMLHDEGARTVKLVISREGTERFNRTWADTPFSFQDDQTKACAQRCVQATVSTQ